MDTYKIILLGIAVVQLVMGICVFPLFSFLLSNQRILITHDNRITALEKNQISPKEMVEDSKQLAKIETLLEGGDKRMFNIEQTLRMILGEKIHPEGDHYKK